MIKSFTAYTQEVDDADTAVSEILEQLDLDGKNKLLRDTIGIVSCFAGYVESGVWEALARALPFEVLGTTTISNAAAGVIGETMLSIMVLTSDELSFSAALSEPITEEAEGPLNALYQAALSKLSGKPSLMLSFSPLLSNFGSDFYVDRMSEISGGVPNFGTLAVDHTSDYHEAYVLSNGKHWKDRFGLILIHGSVSPVFYIGTISDEKVFPEKGVVTASSGNQLRMVNGMLAVDYLLSLGLTKNEEGGITGINSFPIIVDYNDGTMPVVRAMFAVTPEGYAVCGGNIPEGSTISMGSFNPEEIVVTADRTLEKAIAPGKHNAMLIYSCVGRYFTLGYEPLKELEQLQKRMAGAGVTYMAAYSGGEICPVYDKSGKMVNRNHNNTFIICAF